MQSQKQWFIQDMCEGMHYLYAYPHSFSYKQENQKQRALLTYSQEDTTIGDLGKQFRQIFPSCSNSEVIYFTLSKGYYLQNQWTMSYIKKLLKRDNIDGICIYLQPEDPQSEVYINQHGCVPKPITSQLEYNPQGIVQVQIKFVLPSIKRHTIAVNGFYQQKFMQFANKLLVEIKRQLKVQLSIDCIKKYWLMRSQKQLLLEDKIEKGQIQNGDIVQVIFYDKDLLFDIAIPEESLNKLRIYDINMQVRILNYDIVKYYTFKDIYRKYFGKEIQLSKLYLKVMDTVIRQQETLQKASEYFKQSAQFTKIFITGFIVSSKVIFNLSIYNSQEPKWPAFKISDFTRQNIMRFKSQKKKEMNNTKIDDQLLEITYLYTSQAKKDEMDKMTIYQRINRYLRQRKLEQIDLQNAQYQWQYAFINLFINKICLLKNSKRKVVYRGVNYVPTEAIGQKILFQGFTSTSLDKDIAFQHPINQNKRRKILTLKYCLFKMQIEEGKEISKYSATPGEEQILIQPYSEFQVLNITEKQYKYDQGVYNFVIYHVKQVKYNFECLKQINKAVIIWIDDKTKEGKQIYPKFEQATDLNVHSLIFKQFTSTHHFYLWLESNRALIEDKSIYKVVVSNMKRIQNGVINQKAGLDSLNKLLRYDQIPFIFYVYNTNATKSHLKLLKLPNKYPIHVTKYLEDILILLSKYTPLRFQQNEENSCSIQ